MKNNIDKLIYEKQINGSNRYSDEELMILCSLRQILDDNIEKTFQEQWKDIEGYEGLYKVSNYGRIMSQDRKIKCSNGKTLNYKGKIMKLNVNSKTNYVMVTLVKNKKNYYEYVHRIVAKTFIDNHNKRPVVNHIDGDKTNNKFWNLEWCNYCENIEHSFKHKLHNFENKQKPVIQYSLKGEFIAVWSSARKVEEFLNINRGVIQIACKSESNISNGYIWKYIEEKYEDFIEKYAFSYSIGRMTYIVGVFYDYIMNKWVYLSDGFKMMMLKDINEAEKEDRLGMDCDKVYWLNIKNRILDEIEK